MIFTKKIFFGKNIAKNFRFLGNQSRRQNESRTNLYSFKRALKGLSKNSFSFPGNRRQKILEPKTF